MRWAWIIRGVIGAVGIALAVTFYHPWFGGNFSVVSPGKVYRAAQPKDNLGRLIREYRLASILNLRGGSIADPWYASEVRLTRENGVAFYDLPLGATRRPSRRELLMLIDVLDRCRYPLLIHCKSGSDRTGLASGLYLMVEEGASPSKALEAFSIRHGHVAFGGTERLHEPFEEYGRWLGENRLAHTPERLRAWVVNDYRADDSAEGYRPLLPGPRDRRLADQEGTPRPPVR